MNLGASRKLKHSPETGTWFRAVALAHLTTPINTAHTRSTPSRFSAGPKSSRPFEILYLAETFQVAQFEIGALYGDPLVVGGTLNDPRSFAAIHVRVVLHRVADLTDPLEQSHIETTAQELTGDWKGYGYRASPRSPVRHPIGTAPTQDLGEAIFNVKGTEGFRTLSVKPTYHRNLIVLPEKMFVGSRLEFRDDGSKLLQVIEGSVPKTKANGWR